MPSRRSEVLVTEFLRDALAVSALGVPELEARARATGLLGEGQSITHTKAFKRAKKFLRIRSLRAGFGARSQWRWQFVALLGSFLFVLLVPFLSRNESSPTFYPFDAQWIHSFNSGAFVSRSIIQHLTRGAPARGNRTLPLRPTSTICNRDDLYVRIGNSIHALARCDSVSNTITDSVGADEDRRATFEQDLSRI
jgi:hypothetical protein